MHFMPRYVALFSSIVSFASFGTFVTFVSLYIKRLIHRTVYNSINAFLLVQVLGKLQVTGLESYFL